MSQDLVDAARKLLLSYDPLLPDRAFITVLNGDLLGLQKALTPDARNWSGFDYVGSEVAPP